MEKNINNVVRSGYLFTKSLGGYWCSKVRQDTTGSMVRIMLSEEELEDRGLFQRLSISCPYVAS